MLTHVDKEYNTIEIRFSTDHFDAKACYHALRNFVQYELPKTLQGTVSIASRQMYDKIYGEQQDETVGSITIKIGYDTVRNSVTRAWTTQELFRQAVKMIVFNRPADQKYTLVYRGQVFNIHEMPKEMYLSYKIEGGRFACTSFDFDQSTISSQPLEEFQSKNHHIRKECYVEFILVDERNNWK